MTKTTPAEREMGDKMDRPIYDTDTENSFLQELGPFKIQTTGKTSSGISESKFINLTQSTMIGDVKRYGRKQTLDLDQQEESIQ